MRKGPGPDAMPKTLTCAGVLLAAALWALPATAQDAQLPPSTAVRLAVAAVPGSEPLGVRLNGSTYVVKLKQDGQVVQVLVDAVTGAVTPQQ